MKGFKKIMSLALILCIHISSVFVFEIPIEVTAAGTMYEEGYPIYIGAGTSRVRAPEVYNAADPTKNTSDEAWRKLKSLGILPTFITQPYITVSGKKFGFNFKIWNDKAIVVYGRPTDIGINPRIVAQNGYKDWKTKKDDINCGTYYLRDGVRGEYRYHGYDIAGNKYSNTSFPIDGVTQSMNSYEWIYKPWVGTNKRVDIGPWNYRAMQDYDYYARLSATPTPEGTKLAQWIASGFYKDEADPTAHTATTTLNWMSAKPPNDLAGVTNPSYNGRLAYNYAHVMSAPTLLAPGEAEMWINKNGSYRYRTSFIPALKDKLLTKPTVAGTVSQQDLDKLSNIKYKTGDTSESYNDYLKEQVEITVQVTSTLPDKDIYNDAVEKTIKYNRADLMPGDGAWRLKLIDKTNLGAVSNATWIKSSNSSIGSDNNCHGTAEFTLSMKVGDIVNAIKAGKKEIVVSMQSTARFYSQNNESPPVESNSTLADLKIPFSGKIVAPIANEADAHNGDDALPPAEIGKPAQQFITPSIMLPEPAFDIVAYKPEDNTDATAADGKPVTELAKQVFVDGISVDYDLFFNGSYVFGETGYDRLANIEVVYTAGDGSVSYLSRWIRVLNTKPRVQFKFNGSYKENRKQWLDNTSTAANTPEVIQKYPITKYTWTVSAVSGGTDTDIKTGTLNDMFREFTFKKAGSYRIILTGTNTLGRVSDPYVFEFEIIPDYVPAMIYELNNVSIARGEKIGCYFSESVSTDGDEIETVTAKLYYDSDNNGTPETLLQTWNDVSNQSFPEFTAVKLGMYRWVITSKEKMLGDMIPAHITASDAKTKVLTKDFWVDNYVPQTAIYTDVEPVRPNVDVFIMTDKNLAQNKIDYVKTSRMDFNNYLRLHNITPVVEQWDLKTYQYSQAASTSSNTGSTYPAGSVPYSSGGYSGTLPRTSVSDNGYSVDYGSYQTKTEYQTFTGTASSWIHNYGTYNPYTINYSDSPAPSSLYINSNGYSGSISKTGWSCTSDTGVQVNGDTWSRFRTYSAYYSGTLSKTVQYWVSDWRWIPNYTGYYSGTIYKYVRQSFTDPFRSTSDKYVIYVSDGNIGDLSELQAVLNKSGAKLILVSASSATGQITPIKYFAKTVSIENDMNAALNYIIENTSVIDENYILAGVDTFTLNTDDYDEEGDPITEAGFSYIHDVNHFDNSQGLESGAVTELSETAGWTAVKKTMFGKVGKYTIYRRIKDRPSTDARFANYNYYSGTPAIVIYAHRKPIARATLDWDFDPALGSYRTNWVDLSYDLDHQYSRQDKGIAGRKIMFRKAGDSWSYFIPERLAPGSYELNYYVRDVEGVWSDPFVMNFTLNAVAPIQYDAKARAADSRFSMNSIPAGEYLEAFDVWTRYPYPVHLEAALYKGTTRVAPIRTIYYSSSTGSKTGNDINWNPIPYRIPANLPDGSYTFRVSFIGQYENGYKDFPVTVKTPIGLQGLINGKSQNAEIFADENNSFVVRTTQYADRVSINFKGITYTSQAGQIKFMGIVGGLKLWEVQLHIDSGLVEDGETGTARFSAYTPGGSSASVDVNYKVIGLRLENMRITGITDKSWKSLFVKSDGTSTPLAREGIKVRDMPVYLNTLNAPVKLGYKVYFKVDSLGLYRSYDKVEINVRCFTPDGKGGMQEADIYLPDGKGGYDLIDSTSFAANACNITLTAADRLLFETDPAQSRWNTWSFSTYLPASAKAVKKGEVPDPIGDNFLKGSLLVTMEVTGFKASTGKDYDYSLKESEWASGNGLVYGRNKPSGKDLLGKGVNHGEVFWYSLDQTALDDIDISRDW